MNKSNAALSTIIKLIPTDHIRSLSNTIPEVLWSLPGANRNLIFFFFATSLYLSSIHYSGLSSIYDKIMALPLL
jgi:hypothetical protein